MADISSSLTIGERFLVKRKRMGMTQNEMARSYGYTRTTYGRVERDQMPATEVPMCIGLLLPHEEAMILRRRNQETQKQVSERVGLSRHWISKMENGHAPCERLLKG